MNYLASTADDLGRFLRGRGEGCAGYRRRIRRIRWGGIGADDRAVWGCREILDLIVALRNVTRCSIQSPLLTRSRSSSSRGLAEVIGKHGQFCSRYRAGHLLLHRTHHGRGADRHLIQTRIPFKVRPRRWYAWFVCLVRRTRPRAATRHLSIQTSLNRASSALST